MEHGKDERKEGTMQDETRRALAEAREREDARAARYTPPDYANVSRVFRQQKAALTRAVNSGSVDRIVAAVRKAVSEWSEPPFHGAWPDDWSRWQRALDDALGFGQSVRIEDLR